MCIDSIEESTIVWKWDNELVAISSLPQLNIVFYEMIQISLGLDWTYEIIPNEDVCSHPLWYGMEGDMNELSLRVLEVYSTLHRRSLYIPMSLRLEEMVRSASFEEVLNIYSNLENMILTQDNPIFRMIEHSNNPKIDFSWYHTGLRGFLNSSIDDDTELGYNDFVDARALGFEGYITILNGRRLWEMYNYEKAR